ncbi:hypothetical protein IscW_ISCW001864 [Ixodes scapularis]|uniref:Uncharacterized protein n=1 Tax=Ixodes scapularis TaxID=6945 RepID=B7PAG4_IXOSC|nr:hypothetical protein IscW_ISCW001864 [Ixodes scapularis]|eukprot:XP_002406839.1 hypothetical protein IscW_ISCW001864 [Ixodes scapularis]
MYAAAAEIYVFNLPYVLRSLCRVCIEKESIYSFIHFQDPAITPGRKTVHNTESCKTLH